MSENPEIFKIITDYFSGEISEGDKQILDEWLKDASNKKEFKAYAKANFLYIAEPDYKVETKGKVISLFNRNFLKIAAIFVLLLAVGVIWKLNIPKTSAPSTEFISIAVNGDYKVFENSSQQKFLTDTDDVKLASLENGTLRLLKNTTTNNLTINVPNGKNLKVLLTDGTEILLNAGTEIGFNSNFVKDHSRKINLKGQAFFEVAKDKSNPFYVITDQFTTKVLGTKFNISSYKNENEAFVNLVEGKIEVSGTKIPTQKILAPGQKISFSPEIKTPVVEAAKPNQDMDWLNKEIAFENNTTDEVLSKIERVYGLQIVRNRVEVENFHFSGTFKIENLDQITNTLQILLNCKIQKDGSKLILISKN
ncbi:FecR domain-containing protein [Kaistella sp. G5-32]|uniref:FecR domain-containing protein n=1 Tax=Kaistella gelatinilytica TaxID=2787636 RepID=A0ABS0F7J7_9FLAO|nr:FecR domain-containing protein [Kaistella gelatinilytica]MBF8455679.1 FecR domain-containing protein [Kaistella gelatinilytica]